MKRRHYQSIDLKPGLGRREFVRSTVGASLAGGLILGTPIVFAQGQQPPPEPETNIADFMKVAKTKHSLPGPFPGRVIQVKNSASLASDKPDAAVISKMLEQGVTELTGVNLEKSFKLFFDQNDVVGIKVNPVGPPVISTRVEVVEAVINWLTANGLPRKNVVIWDRFDYMLKDAGFTAERFPGVRIESLQTMDEKGNSWRDASGKHVSEANFDQDVYYLAKGVTAKKDDEPYLNQHVFNEEKSFYGKLITQGLTKIINIPVLKNAGNGISVATKNLGYGAVCNTGRLHAPLFFKVCTEVLAAPVIRDRLVLNITDGLRAQYEDGPMLNAQFVYPNHSLYFATDPFALDMVCHQQLVAKRKEAGIKVVEHPRYTDYLRYAEKLGLGVVDQSKMEYRKLES